VSRKGPSPYRPGQVALERALSKLGLASRTRARALIVEGRVRVNGVVRRDPLLGVSPERARIEIDGTAATRAEARVFLLHKPRGTVTTASDEKGRPTVLSLLEAEGIHLIAVGRLDLATTGLLLLTNDTRLAAWLTDPAQAIVRTYVVTVRGQVDESSLDRVRAGFEDRGELLRAEEVVLRKASGRESHLTVKLTEGKNREIRRLFSSLGHEVTRLKRIKYGPLELGELAPGEYRELSRDELQKAFPEY
jgi:23S rRNA pseudouridine2605 synthase